MTTFQKQLKERGPAARKPPRVVELPVSAWAPNVTGCPSAPVPIGLFPPSEPTIEAARSNALQESAIKAADGDEDDRTLAYNDCFIREVLGGSTCLAMDVTKPFFATPLEMANRLTVEGLRRLWQELEVLRVSDSPGMPEIDDAGASHLDAMLVRGVAWEILEPEETRKIRRLLEHCRQVMADAEDVAEKRGVILATG